MAGADVAHYKDNLGDVYLLCRKIVYSLGLHTRDLLAPQGLRLSDSRLARLRHLVLHQGAAI